MISSKDESPGRADIHTHTRYSGFGKYSFLRFPESVTRPAKAVDEARRKKLDVLCITDHNTIRGALIAKRHAKCTSGAKGIEVVAGEEVSTRDGEVLALFIQEPIRPGLGAAETIDMIHAQGGIAVAAHPFRPSSSLGFNVRRLKLDGVEAFNAYHPDAYANLMAQMLSPKGLARLGGSDAHSVAMIGNGYTEFCGNTAEELRKSILRRETSFGGERTPLSEAISWSREVSIETVKMIYKSLRGKKSNDVLYAGIDKIKKRNKILGLIGAGLYAGSPLSVLAGVIGEFITVSESKRKWNEYMSMPLENKNL